MSLWISSLYSYLLILFCIIFNILCIAFDICNYVVVFLVSTKSALSNFRNNSKMIFKNQFTLLPIIYESSSCSTSLPTLSFVSCLPFPVTDSVHTYSHASINFSKVTVRVFYPFLVDFSGFFFLIGGNSLYNPSADISIANIF